MKASRKLQWLEDDVTQINTLDNYFKSVDTSEFNSDGIHKQLIDAGEEDDQMSQTSGGTMIDEEEFADEESDEGIMGYEHYDDEDSDEEMNLLRHQPQCSSRQSRRAATLSRPRKHLPLHLRPQLC